MSGEKNVVLWIRLLSFVDNHETSSGCLKSIDLEAPWVCVPKEGPWKVISYRLWCSS